MVNMAKEAEAVFYARVMILERGDVNRPCTVFVARDRIVVASPEGIAPRVSLVVFLAIGICLAGLVLMNAALFVAGLGATVSVLLFLVLVNFVVRYRSSNKIRRLHRLDEVWVESERNFEIRYLDVVKVKHEAVVRRDTSVASHILLPSLPYTSHLVDFETETAKYTFMIEASDVEHFMDLMRQFIPKKIVEEPAKNQDD